MNMGEENSHTHLLFMLVISGHRRRMQDLLEKRCSCSTLCTEICHNKNCKCEEEQCDKMRHPEICNCQSCDPGNEHFFASEEEKLYESWIAPLKMWIRKAGCKSFLYSTYWKLQLKLRIRIYLHHGLKEHSQYVMEQTHRLFYKIHAIPEYPYTTHDSELSLSEMLPLLSFLNDLPKIDAGEKRKTAAEITQKEAKAVLEKYRLREYNLSLSMLCRNSILFHVNKANCMKSDYTKIVGRKEARLHLHEVSKKSIDTLMLPDRMKQYIKSDRVELDDPDIPPRIYLIIEWFAKDIDKREPWDSFIAHHFWNSSGSEDSCITHHSCSSEICM